MTEVWLTYAQAGERFGLTSDAMRMRARRLGWRSQPGNDGRTLILVPEDTTIEPRARSAEGFPQRAAEQSEVIERFLDRIEAADARAARAEHRAEQAEQRVERAEQRTDQAEQRADAERARADQLRERLEIAHGVLTTAEKRADQLRESLDTRETLLRMAERRAREAEDAAAVLREVAAAQRQAEAERKARGLVSRLRAAWRRD